MKNLIFMFFSTTRVFRTVNEYYVPLLVFSYNIILSPWLLLCNLIAGILIVKEKKIKCGF